MSEGVGVETRHLPSRSLRVITFVTAAALVVILDQLSKAWVRDVLPGTGYVGTLVPGILDLVRVENTGAAFSIGEGAGPLFVAAATFVAIAALVFVVRERIPLSLVTCVGFVAGGGMGNLIDRVIYGSVTDFLATSFISFPVFNVADMFVTCGIMASVVGYIIWDSRRVEHIGGDAGDAGGDTGDADGVGGEPTSATNDIGL